MCCSPRLICVSSTVTGVKRYINAPCGKCVECVKSRQNSWKLRLCEESRNWLHGYFFTLTYSPENLPTVINTLTGEEIGTACKRHVQLWLKSFREYYCREYGERLEFRYFICAEYGSESEYVDRAGRLRYGTARPHYHGVMYFNADPLRVKQLFLRWSEQFGFVNYSLIGMSDRSSRSATSNYVSKYCCKGEFASRVDEIRAGIVEPAWTVCSRHIGETYVFRMRDYHLCGLNCDTDNFYTIEEIAKDYFQNYDSPYWHTVFEILDKMKVCDGEYFYKMPRYYRERLFNFGYHNEVMKTTNCNLRLSCDVRFDSHFVVNPIHIPPITYDYKTVKIKRYSSENYLSLSLAFATQLRRLARYERDFAKMQSLFPTASDTWIHCRLAALEEDSLKAREETQRQKLAGFYFSNIYKNPELNCA